MKNQNPAQSRKETLKTLLIGLCTWIFIAVAAVFMLRAAWKSLLTPPEQPETTQQGQQTQPEATTERVAQMFTGQKVDYTELSQGDTLYAGTVASLVSLEFPDFETIHTVPEESMILFGIWESLKNSDFSGGATASEDRVYITAESVERVVREELGFEGSLNHHSIERFGDFKFDVLTSRYSAPSYGADVEGYAVVRSCEREGDLVTLTVDCFEDDVETGETSETGVRRITLDISKKYPLVTGLSTLN